MNLNYLLNLRKIGLLLILFLSCQIVFGQSFFQTYPDAGSLTVTEITDVPEGLELQTGPLPSSTDFSLDILLTDNSGNLLSAQNFPALDGELNQRLENGDYLRFPENTISDEHSFSVLNSAGEVLNNFTLPFTENVGVNRIFIEYSNGDILLSFYSSADALQLVLFRVNPYTGAVIWEKPYTFSEQTGGVWTAESMTINSQGEVFIQNNNGAFGSYRMIKADPEGQIDWDNSIGGNSKFPVELKASSDGGVWYLWNQVIETITKRDSNGELVANIQPDPIFMADALPLQSVVRPDGGSLTIGKLFSSEASYFTMIVNASGDLITTNTFDLSEEVEDFTAGIRLESGEFVFGGYIDSGSAGSYPFLLKVDENGAFNPTDNNLPDLNLSVINNNPGVGIYDYLTLTYTLTNEGAAVATGIEASIRRTSESVVSGEFPAVASQGTFSLGYLEDALWTVGTLNPGESASLEISYFTLAEDAPFFAEVSAMNESDADSMPGNGNFGQEAEDDEAATPLVSDETLGSISGRVFLDSFREGGVNCQNGGCTFLEGIEIQLVLSESDAVVATALTNAQGQYNFPNLPLEGYRIVYEIQDDYFPAPLFTTGSVFTPVVNNPAFDYTNNFPVTFEPPFSVSIGANLSGSSINMTRNLGLVDGNECTLETLYAEVLCTDNSQPGNPNEDAFRIKFRADGLGSGNYILIDNAGNTIISAGLIYADGFKYTDLLPISLTPVTLIVRNVGTSPELECEEIFEVPLITACADQNEEGVDLELTASSEAPEIYQTGQAVFTLVNTGSQDATDIVVEFNKNATVNLTLAPVVSQGMTIGYWTDTPKWNVGNLAAGQSATITFNLFSLSDEINLFGEVTEIGQADIDSTPNNGNGVAPLEDDEASYPGGGVIGEPCTSISGVTSNLACNNNGTVSDPSDDTFTFNLTVSSNGSTCSGFTLTSNAWSTTGTLGTSLTSPALAISEGTLELTLSLTGNPGVTQSLSINPPATCSTGDSDLPDLTLSNLNISGNGTPGQITNYTVLVSNIGTAEANGDYVIGAYLSNDPSLSSDDVLVGVVNTGNTPVGTEPLTPGAISLPTSTSPGNYFLILETDTNQSINESNESNNQIAEAFTVDSGNSTGVDLEVEIQTNSTVIGQYQNFSVQYRLENVGSSSATGVTLFAPKPTGVVYVGGNEYTASQGTFDVYSTNIWNVGTLAAGANLELTVNYFSLAQGESVLWAEVAGLNELDIDSSPGNGIPFVSSTEDDEVSLSINIGNSISANSFVQNTDDLSARLYPVPVSKELSIEVYTPNAQETRLLVLDAQGNTLSNQFLAKQKGLHRVLLDMTEKLTGVYFIHIQNEKETKTYRFLKL